MKAVFTTTPKIPVHKIMDEPNKLAKTPSTPLPKRPMVWWFTKPPHPYGCSIRGHACEHCIPYSSTSLRPRLSGCGGKIKKLLLPSRALAPVMIMVIGAALLLVAGPVNAGLQALIANYLVLPIAQFFGSLTVTLIGILISVAQYNNFIDVPAVQKGWVLLRDVMNMFFIVILLLIAFGTMFRWENYHYKKLLGKLLIMAVLVNFSKAITGFMIDFAQVLMLTFVNGFADAAAGNFVQGFHLDKMFQFAQNRLTPEEARTLQADEGSFLIAALLALISIFVAMVVVGVIVVVLIFRIVALWFLVIISPIAYTLNVFPGQGQKYADMWWDYFGKYASSGPILAFFLWLSLSVMQITSGKALGVFTKSKDSSGFGLADVPAASITGIGQSEILLSFIVNISLLIGALWMTQQLGVAGGKLAGSAITALRTGGAKIAKAPFKGAWAVAKIPLGAVKRTYKERAPAWLQPVAVWKGMKARGEEKDKEAEAIAMARGRELYTRVITRGKVRIPYEQIAQRHIEAEYQKDLVHMTKEQKGYLAEKVWDKGGPEGQRMKAAILTSAAAEGHIDDILDTDFFRHKAKWTDAQGRKRKGFQDENGVFSDYEKTNQLFYSALGDSQNGLRIMYDIGELGKKIGHYEYYGHGGFDSRTGQHTSRQSGRHFTADGRDRGLEEASDDALGELVKVGQRQQISIHPHNFLRLVGRSGRGGGKLTWGEIDPYFGRKALVTAIGGARDTDLKGFATTRASYINGTYDIKTETQYLDQKMVDEYRDHLWNENKTLAGNATTLFDKIGAKRIQIIDDNGNPIPGREYANPEAMARGETAHDPAHSWNDYRSESTGGRGRGGRRGGVPPAGGGPAASPGAPTAPGTPGGAPAGGPAAPGAGGPAPSPGPASGGPGGGPPTAGGMGGATPSAGLRPQDLQAVLMALDPDGSVQKELWEKYHTEEEQKQIIEQVRTKMGAPEMTEEEARREYFVQGLANETEAGDKSEDAIRLKAEVRDKLAEVAAGVRIEQPVQPKPVSPTAEAEPTTVTGQVQVALENTINMQGGFGNLLSELTKPGLRQEQFFKPLLMRLRNEFDRLFVQQTDVSADVINMRQKLADRLSGLEKMLSGEADRSKFAKEFRSFLQEYGGAQEGGAPSEASPPKEKPTP